MSSTDLYQFACMVHCYILISRHISLSFMLLGLLLTYFEICFWHITVLSFKSIIRIFLQWQIIYSQSSSSILNAILLLHSLIINCWTPWGPCSIGPRFNPALTYKWFNNVQYYVCYIDLHYSNPYWISFESVALGI